MKLSEATNEQKIKALAELDGWKFIPPPNKYGEHWIEVKSPVNGHSYVMSQSPACVPHYLTSYDAIIPLVQKQLFSKRMKFAQVLQDIYSVGMDGKAVSFDALLHATPSQLADALLVATRKFEL